MQGLQFSDAEDFRKTQTGSPQRMRQMHVGYVNIADFRQITRYSSKTVEYKRIVYGRPM